MSVELTIIVAEEQGFLDPKAPKYVNVKGKRAGARSDAEDQTHSIAAEERSVIEDRDRKDAGDI